MTPLVLVHGFMGGSAQWALQSDQLDRPLVPVALPGYGSRATEPAIDTVSGLAVSALADIDGKGIDRFDLLGHSMGGMVVQEIVRQAPGRVNRLILYSTGAVGALPGRFETIAQSKQRARDEGLRETARRIAATWFLEREDAAEFENCAAIAEQVSPQGFDAGLDAMQSWSGEESLSAIAAQTLVLWGDGDRTYPWAQIQLLWQSIHGAQLAVVPGCAHAVHMEKPDFFNRLVRDFLGPV